MRFWVGVTDNDWFDFLARFGPDEVNFWQPNQIRFGAIETGAPFLFKLHSPQNYIVGGGFFLRHSFLPLSFAWEAFGEKNGAPNPETLLAHIRRYRRTEGSIEPDPVIGCIVLAEPVFFAEHDWIPVPPDWSRNIVRGKRYDTLEPAGARLWEQFQARLAQYRVPVGRPGDALPVIADERPRYGPEYLTRARLGQGAFRVLVTEAYGRRCAMTGQRALPVLHAAHIKPFSESGPHRVDNGLLLRSDLHILFDRGYMTITKDHHIEVSRRIKEEFENGEEYYSMHGQELVTVPAREIERPSPAFIEWHNDNVFSD